jgi:hypothetical protein
MSFYQFLGFPVSMHDMEQLISNLPSLKHLELHADGYSDVLDGQQWQILASRLITFNFKFSASFLAGLENLDSFRSPFWLDEKHWFVAYESDTLFSVPYFAKKYTQDKFQPPVLSTLPNNTILNECITKLTLTKTVVGVNHHFNRVHILNVCDSIPLSYIKQCVDLNQIQQLALRLTTYSEFISIINEMPNLYQISILCEVKQFLAEVQCKSFEKIRKLVIGLRYTTGDDNGDYSIEKLYSVFPHIEHLDVDYLCSASQILDYINQFKQLTNASFYIIRYSMRNEYINNTIAEVRLALNENRSSRPFGYTYRFKTSSVHIWF